jgi:hypothetical protein
MGVQSIAVTDYSTGSQYKYTGNDGTWQSITAVGGKVNPDGNGGAIQAAVSPSATGDTNSPMPFQGTHSAKESPVQQPNAGGWTPTTLQTSPQSTSTTYPDLPAGWTVTSSGKVVPPSAAPVSEPPHIGSTPSDTNFEVSRLHPHQAHLRHRLRTRSSNLLRLVDLRSSHHMISKGSQWLSPSQLRRPLLRNITTTKAS